MGHNGYLNINDRLYYCAKSNGSDSDMDSVTEKISFLFPHMSKLLSEVRFLGLPRPEFEQFAYGDVMISAHADYSNSSVSRFYIHELDIYHIAKHCAKEIIGLEEITQAEALKKKEPSLAIKIDSKNKKIYLNSYTCQWMPKKNRASLTYLLQHEYSIITTEYNPLTCQWPITETEKSPDYVILARESSPLWDDGDAEIFRKNAREKVI